MQIILSVALDYDGKQHHHEYICIIVGRGEDVTSTATVLRMTVGELSVP